MADFQGVPTQELVRFHARQAKGGVALTLVAYANVSRNGRSFPTQISLNGHSSATARNDTVKMLKRLTAAVHAQGALAGIQITHAGAFADPACNEGLPSVGPSRIFNPLTMRWSKVMSPEEMLSVESDFVSSVHAARACGFDAVELHCGHGYLLSQFLSRATNAGAGSASDRLQFPLRIVRAVVAAAHNERSYIAVLVKFNCSEKHERDLPFQDVCFYARAFYDAGVDLLVPSGGQVMTNGLHMLRGGRPIAAMAAAQKNIMKRLVS
jgi:2,4-dienoyl-CoA reductase-like NADH-dependent reductase (Old Yellow Enzyme family)